MSDYRLGFHITMILYICSENPKNSARDCPKILLEILFDNILGFIRNIVQALLKTMLRMLSEYRSQNSATSYLKLLLKMHPNLSPRFSLNSAQEVTKSS